VIAEDSVLELAAVSKVYRRRGQRNVAVNAVSARFAPGIRTGVVGESGSGKSTLARLMCGLSAPTDGAVLYGGASVSQLVGTTRTRLAFRRAVQFVAQDVGSSFEPGASGRDSVIRPALSLHGPGERERLEQRLVTLADAFHLERRVLDRDPSQLSGGQRQRLSLIRGLLVAPRYLICDEVISALDVSVQAEVLNTLHDVARETNIGLVFIAHNLPATLFLCERIAVMYRGDLVEMTTSEELVEDPRHPYTRELLASYREMVSPR
jgi:peptide/nickel transport system ATP-binding protein